MVKSGSILIIGVILISVVGGGLFLSGDSDSDSTGSQITVFRSSSCGCCVSYISQLKSLGYNVEAIINNNINSIKAKYNIPGSMGSCHTSIIGDYFVEGHVPFEAITKLLEERPNIDGIAMPGMPEGSPGMPGHKRELFTVYSVNNGRMQDVFMEI
jgi:hypothetical protein